MNKLILILLLLLPVTSFSQFAYYNSEAFWKRLQLHPLEEAPPIGKPDTAIIVASNRILDTAGLRFLPEERDGSQIRYFVVYAAAGRWHIQPVPSLKAAISTIPRPEQDWVVYTEGMGKFFTSGVERGMYLSAQYGVQVILLDYPSITSHRKRLGNYFFARRNAKINYRDFVPVLDTLQMMRDAGVFGSSRLSLFFHSMGNIMMRQAAKHGQMAGLNESQWVDNLILNAPCIPQRGHKRFLGRIAFARHTYIHYNPADFTLGGAYLMTKRFQLGKQVRKPLLPKATYVNFNALVGEGHSYFLNLGGRHTIPAEAARHYNQLFHGLTPDLSDTLHYRPTAYRGIGYDILPGENGTFEALK